jgi:urea transport system permease protein
VLAWAAAGAVVVNWAKTSLSEQFPSGWLYLEGLLFVVVIAFAPRGLAGIAEAGRTVLRRAGSLHLRGRARLTPGPTPEEAR